MFILADNFRKFNEEGSRARVADALPFSLQLRLKSLQEKS
jgi:hypothetical protein